jgi:hypothetical protein
MFIRGEEMKKYFMVGVILLISIVEGYASTCVKDINGDGVIDAKTEKWDCLATEPPTCPQDMVNCTTAGIVLSGSITSSQTNVKDKIGITKVSADDNGSSLIIDGWICSDIACSSGNIGSIKIQNATVSGSVSADKISRMVGNGSDIEIFGCNGGTSCAETMIGKVNINGALITGSAAADAGLISIAANSSTLSISGMTCGNSGCYQISAGTLSITGFNAVCPAGSQHSCVDVSGIKKCSPLTCNDDTYGGKVSAGQQICVKDLNQDGNIDFSTEMSVCQKYNNQYYCPLQAQDCTNQTTAPLCPAGGNVNLSTKKCEININNNYKCPGTGTVYQDQSECNSNCTQTGTINATQNYTCSTSGTVYHDQSSCSAGCPHTETTAPIVNYTCSGTSTLCQTDADCSIVTPKRCTAGINGYRCYIRGYSTRTYPTLSACTAACKKTTYGSCNQKTYSCPNGYTYQNNTCVRSASANCTGPAYTCPTDYTLQGNMCVKTVSTACTGPTYTCPTGYNQGAGNTCTAVPSCTVGTLDNATMQCVTGYTCQLGSQFNCFPNTDKNNVMQCNNVSCIDGSTQNPTTNTSDNSTYHDDGQKDANGKCLGTIMIFNGKPLECRPSGVNTNFFNCCDQSDGSFLIIKKMCGEPDTECVAKASTGSCHFIGDYCKQEWWLIGCVQRANVFCCFNSMLARIIHEQGRPQLQSFNGWGSVGAPDCRGFTEEEFSHIDFSKIDFSEYINATKTKMDNKMQTIQNKLTQQNKSKIEEKIQ